MKFDLGISVCLMSLLASCATAPTMPPLAEQAAYYTEGAKDALAKGDDRNAVAQIEIALQRPSGESKIKAFFAANPRARQLYETDIENAVSQANTIYRANEAREKLVIARTASMFPASRLRVLDEALVKNVLDGNLRGTMNIDFGDRLSDFPELATPVHQRAIADRAIVALQVPTGGARPVRELMEYINRAGPTSGERERIRSLLPSFNIRGSEIHFIAEKYPQYAAARKAETTALVFLQFKNGDRLFADDLQKMLRRQVQGVDWLQTVGPKATVVTVERIRNDEKVLPERKQTVTYAQHEVSLFQAALLMPRNASYIYEVVTGGAEIEYGYAVSASVDGRLVHDELIRGKVGGETRRCENARIQNVFGGVTSAGFVANADMERNCAGTRTISVDDLRNDVLKKIVDGILNVPAVKAAHALN